MVMKVLVSKLVIVKKFPNKFLAYGISSLEVWHISEELVHGCNKEISSVDEIGEKTGGSIPITRVASAYKQPIIVISICI